MCRRVQGSQIFNQNWIISIRSRVIVILLIWVSLAPGSGAGGWGCLGWSTIVYMSSGMSRGKESSNRIELSRLVQELLNFGVSVSLGFWGWGQIDEVGVVEGYPPHMCTCLCMHAHTPVRGKPNNFMQMAASMGFLGNPWEFPMMSYMHTCVHMHVQVCGGYPFTTPHPQGGPLESVKIR